ncbi:MAG: hypothetical protein AB8B95_06105 [Pseudohongiellaceae bacterium]
MNSDLDRIKKIILGEEYDSLLKLREEINDDGQFSKIVSNIITEALKERSRKDDSISEVLAPTIDQAISSSINQDPKKLAESLYPIMGPAIRKSITETMQQMLDNLNQLLEESVSPKSLRWRFDAWRTGKSYSELVLLNTLEFSVEQVFLIHRETSLLINHQYSELADTRDPDMVSGMFSAIQDFIEDSFSTQEGDELDTLRLGDLTVVIQRGPSAILAAVVRGRVPEALRSELSKNLEKMHRMKKAELSSYQGDPDVFLDCEDDLRTLLMSEKREEKAREVPWLAVLSIIVIVAGIGYWNYLLYQDSQIRASLVDTFAQEPGYILLDSSFADDVLNVELLVDPDAREPADVAALEHEKFSVEVIQHAQLSLLDSLVEKRAFRLLDPANETALTVNNSVLVLSGIADNDWLESIQTLWPAVTGLTSLDSSGLTLYFPRREAIERAVPVVEAARLPFANGETVADFDVEAIDLLAREINQLNELVLEEVGGSVKIDVVGYTDESGTTDFNRQVGLERAQSFRQILINAGVADDILTSYSAFDHPSNDGIAERMTRLVVDPSSLVK